MQPERMAARVAVPGANPCRPVRYRDKSCSGPEGSLRTSGGEAIVRTAYASLSARVRLVLLVDCSAFHPACYCAPGMASRLAPTVPLVFCLSDLRVCFILNDLRT